MDFDFSPEENEFALSFRKFCEKEIAPHTAAADEAGELPRSHYTKLGECGYTGLLHKPSFGGQDASLVQTVLAQTILSEYCGSTFFSVGASCGLFGGPIADYGAPAVAEKMIPALLTGKAIGCLAVTEPDTGTDVSAIKTRVTRNGNGSLQLSGQKTYITNAPIADHALVLARYSANGQSEGSLTCFLVPLNRPGVSRGKPMKKMGLRASPTGELFFEGVELTESDILGKPGQGFRIVMEAFQLERLSLAAYCVGVMRACMEDSRKYSRERKSFGRPIAKHQSVAFMLADMKTKLEAASLLLWETAWLMDSQRAAPKKSSKIIHNGYSVDLGARAAETKLLASTYAREVANLAVQLHGGAGYMEEFRVCRLYRDVKIAEIGGGTSEIQRQIVAHAELKRIRE